MNLRLFTASMKHWGLISFVPLLVLQARADIVVGATAFDYTGATQYYTVPANAQYVVVKAWGASGGGGFGPPSGGGGFVSARYSVSPGQTITVNVGGPGNYASGTWPNPSGGGWNGGGLATDVAAGGGGASVVVTPNGSVYAGGGGGSGWSNAGAGGAGGGLDGQNGAPGGSTATSTGGGGGTLSGGGAGGSGQFGENGTNGSFGQGGNGGTDGGPSSWYVDMAACGGGGGGGYYGGGGGGTGDRSYTGGGGGGGGGSSCATGAASEVAYSGGSGITPGGTSDPYYPGASKGYGVSAPFSMGNSGYVVIVAYQQAGPPQISSSLSTISLAQRQGVSYTITATNNPTSFNATNLPPGLTVNSSTGVITGNPTAAGTYNSTISAGNSYGVGSATLTWSITAAAISVNGSVSPNSIYNGQSVTLTRDGWANFGIAWFENSVFGPNGFSAGLGNTGAGSMVYTPTAGPGDYWYRIRIVDNYYNYNEQWISFTVTTPVVSAPTSVSATTTGTTLINLAWSGATAQAGIQKYNVYRNGSYIGSTTGTTFNDSGLSALTNYSYVVYTVDNQNTVSAASMTLNVTTLRDLVVFSPAP